MVFSRKWLTHPPTLQQVELTRTTAAETQSELERYLTRLVNARDISPATYTELFNIIKDAIRKAEIAIVTEREYDFDRELKEKMLKADPPADLSQFKGRKIVVKSKTTIEFEE